MLPVLWNVFFIPVCVLHGVLGQGGAIALNRLLIDLFSKYNPEVRPCLNYIRATEVTAFLNVAHVMNLRWMDELLTWSPEKYDGIQRIFVKENRVWRPGIAIYNSVTEKVYIGDDHGLVIVLYNVGVTWEPVLHTGVTCKFMPATPFMFVLKSLHHSQYLVDPYEPKLITIPYEDEGYILLVFRLKLTRRPSYLVITFLLPLTLLAVLCVVSFMLSPEVPEKMSLTITILLSFTVYLNLIDQELPKTSDGMSRMVVDIIILLFLSFLCVTGNAIVIVIHPKDIKSQNVRRLQSRAQKHLADGKCEKQVADVEDNDLVVDQQTAIISIPKTRAERINTVCLVANFSALTLTVSGYLYVLIIR